MTCSSAVVSCALLCPLRKKKPTDKIHKLHFFGWCFLNAIQRVNKEENSAKMYYSLFRKRENNEDNIWKDKIV